MNKRYSPFIERIREDGNFPGDYRLVADILHLAAKEAGKWTKRSDDAKRIPDLLYEIADYVRGGDADSSRGKEEYPEPHFGDSSDLD
jgi:hypothetical protein